MNPKITIRQKMFLEAKEGDKWSRDNPDERRFSLIFFIVKKHINLNFRKKRFLSGFLCIFNFIRLGSIRLSLTMQRLSLERFNRFAFCDKVVELKKILTITDPIF